MSRPLNLTTAELAYLVRTVRDRVETIEDTECNNPAVRMELYAEMSALRVALEQLEGQP